MKNVLFISYYFPPIYSVESTMALNAIKYLPCYNWEPIVLAADRSKAFKVDLSSLELVPPQFKIKRTYSLGNLIVKVASKLGLIPDAMFGWVPFALRVAKVIVQREQIDIIVSRSNPIASHLVAQRLIKYICPDTPWIVLFGDPWTQNPYVKDLPDRICRYHDKIENNILQEADAIVVTTELTRQLFIKKYSMADKIYVLPNTYDTQEFEKLALPSVLPRARNKKFTITHAGNFYGLRSPEPLFKALKLLIQKYPDLEQNMKVQLIGSLDSFGNLIEHYGLQKLVEEVGQLSRRETLQKLSRSHALLLVDADELTPNIFLPTKLVEYLALKKPIIGITPIGESNNLIKQAKAGVAIDPRDISKIASVLEHYLKLYDKNKLTISPDLEVIKKYSANNYAQTLSKLMNKLIKEKIG